MIAITRFSSKITLGKFMIPRQVQNMSHHSKRHKHNFPFWGFISDNNFAIFFKLQLDRRRKKLSSFFFSPWSPCISGIFLSDSLFPWQPRSSWALVGYFSDSLELSLHWITCWTFLFSFWLYFLFHYYEVSVCRIFFLWPTLYKVRYKTDLFSAVFNF